MPAEEPHLAPMNAGGEVGPAVTTEAMRRGLLINAPRPDCLRFMPSLTVTHDEIDRMLDILDATLAQIARAVPG
jgi:acetylornithine/N-succinyldiaminopimelate aminotransferase